MFEQAGSLEIKQHIFQRRVTSIHPQMIWCSRLTWDIFTPRLLGVQVEGRSQDCFMLLGRRSVNNPLPIGWEN